MSASERRILMTHWLGEAVEEYLGVAKVVSLRVRICCGVCVRVCVCVCMYVRACGYVLFERQRVLISYLDAKAQHAAFVRTCGLNISKDLESHKGVHPQSMRQWQLPNALLDEDFEAELLAAWKDDINEKPNVDLEEAIEIHI